MLVGCVFRCRCALTGRGLWDPARPKFKLCVYDAARPPLLDNVLFVTTDAAQRHAAGGIDALAAPLRAQIDARFASGLGGRRRSILQEELARAPGAA